MSIKLGLLVLMSIADVSGYVQTPKGGQPGTTDVQRPTLQELGIQQAPIVDRVIRLDHGKQGIYLGYQQIQLQGHTKLVQPLLTYKISIPRSTPIDSTVKFDWYRLGYFYAIGPKSGAWSVAPIIQLVLFDFDYRFKTSLANTGRAYHHVGIRIGIHARYKLTDTITLTFHRSMSLPWPKILQISLQQDALEIRTKSNEKLMIGQQSMQIRFKDSQKMPNELYLNAHQPLVIGMMKK